MEIIWENDWRPELWSILGPYLSQNRPENLAPKGNFSDMPEITHEMPVNQVSWSRMKMDNKSTILIL